VVRNGYFVKHNGLKNEGKVGAKSFNLQKTKKQATKDLCGFVNFELDL